MGYFTKIYSQKLGILVVKTTINKQVSSSVLHVGTSTKTIDNHMATIQVQIRKNTIEDVLLDGGYGVNIIIERLRLRLGLESLNLHHII